MENRYLITTIRQVDGVRELYARTKAEADKASAQLRADPAMLDAIRVAEWVDVDRRGTRTRYVLDNEDSEY